MASISLRHVRKSFGSTVVIPDLSLEIRDRELIVFVGPSGCGKSTLLRCIAGLEPLDTGEIWIGERNVTDIPPAQRDVAMVFQEYALYPHKTVYENMAFGLAMRETPAPEIDERVRRIAGLLRIEPFLDRKPKALSGGQRQRVAMGRAMVRMPQVFLFDEPLSNLDAKLRAEVRTEIKALARQLDTTMIYVTHDQIEAMTMADRIVVLKDGVVQQVGTPPQIYDEPANQFVAAFIGTPTMNFFDARFEGGRLQLAGGVVWPVTDAPRAAVLRAHGGAPLRLGVRAEHMKLLPAGEPGIEATASVVETLGSDTFVYFDFDGARRVARVVPELTPRVGERVNFGVEMRKAYLFDKEGNVLR